jgi:hypothetical protein
MIEIHNLNCHIGARALFEDANTAAAPIKKKMAKGRSKAVLEYFYRIFPLSLRGPIQGPVAIQYKTGSL